MHPERHAPAQGLVLAQHGFCCVPSAMNACTVPTVLPIESGLTCLSIESPSVARCLRRPSPCPTRATATSACSAVLCGALTQLLHVLYAAGLNDTNSRSGASTRATSRWANWLRLQAAPGAVRCYAAHGRVSQSANDTKSTLLVIALSIRGSHHPLHQAVKDSCRFHPPEWKRHGCRV